MRINLKLSKLYFVSLTLTIILLVTFLAPYLFTGWNDIDFNRQLLPPSIEHPFGTDHFGRDMVDRVFHGLRISLGLAVIIEVVSLIIGLVIGLVLGFRGGVIDEFFTYIMNVLMAFPRMVMALCMIAILGPSLVSLVIVITFLGWITYARLVRSQVLAIKQKDYVLAVRAVGGSNFHILTRHILPNVILPLIPLMTLMIGHAVLIIAGLNFLGFGVQPPMAEIGLMLNEAMNFMNRAPWLMIFPGLLLAVCVLLFNLLGDALRDYLDPKKVDKDLL